MGRRHPLRTFYETKAVALRNKCALRKTKTRTKRFLNSFIEYQTFVTDNV